MRVMIRRVTCFELMNMRRFFHFQAKIPGQVTLAERSVAPLLLEQELINLLDHFHPEALITICSFPNATRLYSVWRCEEIFHSHSWYTQSCNVVHASLARGRQVLFHYIPLYNFCINPKSSSRIPFDFFLVGSEFPPSPSTVHYSIVLQIMPSSSP